MHLSKPTLSSHKPKKWACDICWLILLPMFAACDHAGILGDFCDSQKGQVEHKPVKRYDYKEYLLVPPCPLVAQRQTWDSMFAQYLFHKHLSIIF
jgi:hypothetical protein